MYANALRELAEPRPVGDQIKAAIGRAARAAGIPYARAFNVWYRRARRIDAHEAALIDSAIQHRREEEARNEIAELRTRLLKMESRIVAEAAHQRSAHAEGLGMRLRGSGGADRAVASACGKKGR